MRLKNLPGFIFFTAIALFFFLGATAQVNVVRSDNKVIIEGKVFYLHVVKAGQTLYSVSRAYDVSEKDITKENPGTDSGLQLGQVLKIPTGLKQEVKTPAVVPPDTIYPHHEVKQGETMYSIAKEYNISIDVLDKINPLIVNHEIKIGQLINIPRNKTETTQDEFTFHKVKRRDTIFGIAKLYNISEELLKKYNPDLYENPLKPGQILKIPHSQDIISAPVKTEVEKHDTLQEYEVLKYDPVKIAGKYAAYIDSLPDFSGKTFNVAYLMPFDYKPAEELVPVEDETKSKDDIVNLDHEFNPDDQMLSSRNFLEFIEGSLLAIDSLRTEGISLNVFIYDTKKSPERTRELVNSEEFKKINLIIGPFYSYDVDIVSEFSRLNRVPMISPLAGEGGPVDKNPFFFQLNPGYKTEYDRIADYLSGFQEKNIIFIHGVDSLELLKYNYLKGDYIHRLSEKSPGDSIPIREIKFDYTANASLTQDLQKTLSPDTENVVVVPEADEAFVSSVVTQLYFQLKTYPITVVGLPHWNTFQNIDFMYFHKLSLTYFTPYYFSYDSANVKHFLKDYRTSFYSEPVTLTKKGGSYAFLGYDLSYNFLKIMNKYGRKFILHLNDTHGHEMMNDFHFIPVGAEGGFENRSLVLVKFLEDLDIKAAPYAIAVPEDEAAPAGTFRKKTH